ncbi:MAG TPA: D-alanyl-D-alanine carboxypeptidase, partial [Longimicrobiales bacterium]
MKRLLSLLSLVLLGACVPPLPGLKPHPDRLALVVDSVTSAPALVHTTFGVEAIDAATGRVLIARNADKHLIPASNTKLVATSAAMALLGPDWRYRTELRAAPLDARGATRVLVLSGRGDPTWSPPFQAADATVPAALADSVRAAGVKRIDGDIVIDASRFEAAGVHDAWEIGDLIWYYAAPTSAVAVGEGTRKFVVLPGMAAGLPAGVRFIGPEPQRPVLNAIL